MRKTVSALLIGVTLILPVGTYAATDGVPPPIDSSLEGSPEYAAGAAADATARRVEELTKAGDSLGCGQAGEFGGAMSNALDNALKGLIGSVIGQVKGKVGDLINEIGAKAGPLKPLVDFAAKKILPELDKQLNKLGESLVKELGLGDTLSGVGKALGVDLGGIAGALGVSIPGLGALPIPGIGGGVAVPVSEIGDALSKIKNIDKTTTINEDHLNQIKQAEKNGIYVTCVLNPAVAKARNELIKQQIKAKAEWVREGNNGNPIFVQNLGADMRAAQEAAAKQLIEEGTAPICSSFRPAVQRIATTQWTRPNDYGKSVQCAQATGGSQQNGQKNVDTWWRNLFDLGNSPNYVVLKTQEHVREVEARIALTSVIEYTKNEGFYNKCREDRANNVGEYCLDGTIVTHGAAHAEALNNVLDLGNQQLVEADEIGELIDTMMQELQQFAFENLEGLLGLASDKEGGSYVDELTGSTNDDSLSQLQGILSSDIRGALTTEQAYLDALKLVIGDLEAARTSYTEVISCYQPLTTAGSPTITATTAREVVDLASTTIRSALTPQLSELYIEQANSETSIEELTSLLDQAESVLTLSESATVSNSFTALKESGLMHNATDLEYL
ncbi:MAG: hypothetical protein NBV63_02200, partial [Candidatus Pacebacteria bacterium]|nr:hypothetical protein [Candidatus Paceibacterota bacterium]